MPPTHSFENSTVAAGWLQMPSSCHSHHRTCPSKARGYDQLRGYADERFAEVIQCSEPIPPG